ncbi:MAG: hypothetical protein WD768_11070 [Phycisphaeraceae bacterium]
MQWLSGILIVLGMTHVVLAGSGGLKVMRIFGAYDMIAAYTLVISGICIWGLTHMKSSASARDKANRPEDEDRQA